MKPVDWFLGHGRINLRVAQCDLIHHVLGDTREALVTWDGTDPKDGNHPIRGDFLAGLAAVTVLLHT